MECLRNYIGIKGCGIDAVDSNMYLNTLPGIEFASIDQIANADQVDYAGVWQDVQDRAILRFREDVLGMISGFDRRYKLRQITQTIDLGKSINATITTPASAKLRGHTIELNEKSAQCVCSNMQTIYIQTAQFYSTINGVVNLYVKNIDTFENLYTKSVTAAIGWNIVNIDQDFEVNRLAVVVDVSNIATPTLDISQFVLSNLYTGADQICSSCGGAGFSGGFLWFDWGCACTAIVQGYQIDLNSVNDSSEVYGINTFGVSCVYSVKCSYNNVVCKNKRSFANAFRWLLGAEIMSERIYSSRINKWTTVDLKKAEALRAEYEIEYRGGTKKDGTMIEGSLKTIIYGIDLNLSDCCLQTDAPIRFAESLM